MVVLIIVIRSLLKRDKVSDESIIYPHQKEEESSETSFII